ncbi:signal recognition particle-docking protein FtsY [Oleiagrimonas sp. C23AA]|uniref:signal recognition particle-docking protein FtsY n=1 Tax=Oleiagrimonas sp. C23AA TaxID=2719047 RepID=UPI001422D4ED|nr:signal recognition particle-docking protein FtsY [Oleiagrimonas sp. C23AA]NII11559.1 signal recognition particle-docking protein FtsY [Oleiagrimonas sp. C23AA]
MLKFWKKKNDKTPPDEAVEKPLDDSAEVRPETAKADDIERGERDALGELDAAASPLIEALAEDPSEAATTADETSAETEPAQAPKPRKRSWRERLSGSGFARGLAGVFSRHPKLDDDLLDELETVLLTADVGVTAAMELVEDLRRRMNKREFSDAQALLEALRADLVHMLEGVVAPLDVTTHKPFVVLTVGVNGVGKTTTIGKLAYRQRDEGRRVMLAAGDTFRAAAVEQLKTWGERNGVPVISQGQGADSASVIFDAVQGAKARGADVLIADTAGRLHTQGGLMDELGKIARVLRKIDETAPHEVLMVIDGTTGQNAVNQVRQFGQAVPITGLVVTKLDGTAKGGVVFALAREFGLPIRYVGLGEQITDLRAFDAQAFVDGLLPAQLGE